MDLISKTYSVEINDANSQLTKHFENGFLFLVDIIVRNNKEVSEELKISYRLFSPAKLTVIEVNSSVKFDEKIDSIAGIWNNAYWIEREITDMFGLRFMGELPPRERILSEVNEKNYPLINKNVVVPYSHIKLPFGIQPLVTDSLVFNIGPYHPFTNNGFELGLEVNENLVCNSVVNIGYHHKGIEKRGESIQLSKLHTLASFMKTGFDDTISVAISDAVEGLCNIEIPNKAKTVRMVLMELDRLKMHFIFLAKMANIYDAREVYSTASLSLELVLEMRAKLFGTRSGGNLACVGGLKSDFDGMSIASAFEILENLNSETSSLHTLIKSSSIWSDRLLGGEISRDNLISSGISGPNLRASGINLDLRKRAPIYFYDDVKFEVPCGIESTSYMRTLIRLEEIKQSLAILVQLFDYIPNGEYRCDIDKEKFEVSGSHTTFVESPSGSFGVTVYAEGDGKPSRFRITSPDFFSASTLEQLESKVSYDTFLAKVLSLDINASSCDR